MKKILLIFTYILLFLLGFYLSGFLIEFVCLPLVNNGIKLILLNLTSGIYVNILISLAFTFLLLNPLLLYKLLNHFLKKWGLSHKIFSLFVIGYSSFLVGIISSYIFIIIYFLQNNSNLFSNSNNTLDAVMFVNNLVFQCLGIGLVFEVISILISIKVINKRA